jgi:hypothetical protein
MTERTQKIAESRGHAGSIGSIDACQLDGARVGRGRGVKSVARSRWHAGLASPDDGAMVYHLG